MGDELVIDGGMASFKVVERVGNDLRCKCSDSGLFLPGAKFSFWRDGRLVQRNFHLPTLSDKVSFLLLIVRFHNIHVNKLLIQIININSGLE